MYDFVPVPPVEVNARDESARPKVVVIPDPPLITIGAFTVITKLSVAVADDESVTVIVSV